MNHRLIFLFLLFIPFSFFSQSDKEIDSLRKIADSGLNDTVRISALSELNWYYVNRKPLLAWPFARKEMELAGKLKIEKWTAFALNDLALACQQNALFDSAIYYNRIALKIRERSGSKNEVLSSLNKIGLILYQQTNYTEALQVQLRALKIAEELKDKKYTGFTYNNISQIYDRLKNYKKSIEYGEKALQMHKETGDRYAMGYVYGNIADAYKLMGDLRKSDEYLTEAETIFIEANDSINLASILNSRGLNLRLEKKDREALEIYKRALVIAQKTGEKLGIETYTHNLSAVYLDLGEYQKAKELGLLVLKMADSTNFNQRLMTYRTLTNIYSYLKDPKNSEKYLDKYVDLKEKIFSDANAQSISEMEVKYQTEKKEKDNLLLQKDIAERDASINKRNFLITAIGSVLIFVLVVSVFIYQRNKLKQKQKFDAEMLKQQEVRAREIIEAEEKERIRLARELHDGVGQLLSAAKLNLSDLHSKLKGNENEQKIIHAMELVDDSVKEVRSVSHNMMPNALIQFGLVRALQDFISKISTSESLKIDLEIVGLNERLEQTTETVLYRVLQELVNNVMKHSAANHLSIQLIRHENELTMMLEDNGKGFDINIVNEAAGIGLKNIVSRINFLKGTVNFDSAEGKGTTVVIEIPV